VKPPAFPAYKKRKKEKSDNPRRLGGGPRRVLFTKISWKTMNATAFRQYEEEKKSAACRPARKKKKEVLVPTFVSPSDSEASSPSVKERGNSHGLIVTMRSEKEILTSTVSNFPYRREGGKRKSLLFLCGIKGLSTSRRTARPGKTKELSCLARNKNVREEA